MLTRLGKRRRRGATSILPPPSMDFRFAANKAFPGAPSITFSRGSSGTYFDKSGTIQTATTNAPRFDHDPSTGVSLGLLIEGARTNSFLNSGTPASHTSPSLGTGTYTLWLVGTGSIEVAANTATITGAGTATDGSPVTFSVTGAGTVDFTVTGTPTRAQCEDGAFPSSYIATTSGAITRAADVCSIAGINAASWFSQDAGTVLIEWRLEGAPAGSAQAYQLSFTGNSAADQSGVNVNSGNSDRFEWAWRSGGTFDSTLFVTGPAVADTDYKSAIAWGPSADFRKMYVNGTGSSQDDSSNAADVDTLFIGEFSASSSHLFGTIKRVRFWKTRLSDAQLASLTT